MRTLLPLVVLLASTLAPAPAPAARLAVLELRGTAVSPDGLAYLGRRIRGQALRQLPSDWEVMTRENMLVLIDAANGECMREGECEVETGRNIGADLVVSGEVVRFGGALRVTMALYDTHSGRLRRTAEAAARDESGLVSALPRACGELLAGLKEPPVVPPQPVAPPPAPPPPPPPPPSTGSLIVEGRPPGARVEVVGPGGRSVGRSALPALVTDLAAGRYVVVVMHPGYRVFEHAYEVPAGGQTRVWVELYRRIRRRR